MPVPSTGSFTTDDDFVQNSYLTYIIPYATDFQLGDALEKHGEPPKAFFEAIEDRDWLFFGMKFRIMSPFALLIPRR
jgi:hypothetical protein